jgi:hypothetical protein
VSLNWSPALTASVSLSYDASVLALSVSSDLVFGPSNWSTVRTLYVSALALDSAAAGGSLMDMQTVSFVAGKPVFTKYMDTFPFPYYVLLRDVSCLPRTLAGLLRQWFELSAV